MKLKKQGMMGVLVGLGMLTLSVTTVFAEEQMDQKESSVHFEVESGGLKITRAEDIDFGKLMLDGQDHNLSSTRNGEELVTISDFYGKKSNWDLNVRFGDTLYPQFGLRLSLNPKHVDPVKSEGITLAQKFNVSADATNFARTDPSKYTSGYAHDLQTGSSLFVPATAPARQMNTTLVWTLVANF